MRLNLGCGMDIKEGWINYDITLPANILGDMREGLPFKTGVFDQIEANHILEHISDLKALQAELARVLKSGGELKVVVPYYLSPDAWGDPTHCRAFSEQSFLTCYWVGFDLVLLNTTDYTQKPFDRPAKWLHVALRRNQDPYFMVEARLHNHVKMGVK